LTGGVTHQLANWNRKTNWECTQFAARVEAAAGNGGAGLGRPPALNNQSWANLDLDGITIADGVTTAVSNDYGVAQVSRPVLIGRFAAANGDTTTQHQPINDQQRSRQIIEKLASGFSGIARQKWISTPDNEKPRCLEDLRWEGQAARADGQYGFYSWLMRNFISEAFRTAKYQELAELSFLTYPEKRSKDGQIEPRNMPDFISYYKMALEISETNFGDIQNQRHEFLRRIPNAIVQEIKRWMAQDNMNPTTEELYQRAMNNEAMMTSASFYRQVAPLTRQTQRSRKNDYSNYAEFIYGVNNITRETNNLCIQHYNEELQNEYEEYETSNITGRFSGGLKKGIESFRGIFKTD
jgi:hypothetical protein